MIDGPIFSGCGLFGAIASANHPEARIDAVDAEAMRRALRHRGPDESGVFRDPDAVLGHTRLSVLDLSRRGRQPMTRGALTITYNGEIYNYRELRRALEEKGYPFESATDTEVALRAFQEWGTDCLRRFNGMFALAIWNARTRELFLARDRVGIKPLYYHRTDRFFVFASEAEAILRSGVVRGEIDEAGLAAQILLRSYYEPQPERTLLKGVRLLTPGSWMIARPTSGQIEADGPRPFWTFPEAEGVLGADQDMEALSESFMERFADSVRLRLISDAPLGSFLSGGTDSSLVTAVASRYCDGERLAAFTISDGQPPDLNGSPTARDLAASRYVAERHAERIDHREIAVNASELSEDLMDAFVDMAWLADDPRYIGLYRNYQTIQRSGLKVVLNGQGPDETMGGYIAENPLARLALEPGDDAERARSVLGGLCAVEPRALNPAVAGRRDAFVDAALALYRAQPGGGLRRSHLFLARTLMHRTLLFEDFMSMKFGVECRVPFLDHRVVEFAFSIPFQRHIRADGAMGKMLVRAAAQDLLPQEIVHRPKQPFPPADRERLREASRAIYCANRRAARDADAVAMVYRREALTEDGAELPLKDLWLINNLTFWERRLRRASVSGG